MKTLLIRILNRFKVILFNSRLFCERIFFQLLFRTTFIKHSTINLKFYTPNAICRYRAKSFTTKEPDTLDWIESFDKSSIFWDIGANVGTYSIYAALKKECIVYAFEPSIFNLEVLARNINLNSLSNLVHILPVALNNRVTLASLEHSNLDWGGALSAFEHGIDEMGKEFKGINFGYRTIGLTMDFALKYLDIKKPDYIKIDVDGIEHLILEGGRECLMSAKEVLVEINGSFLKQDSECSDLLKSFGFKLIKKNNDSGKGKTTANQIWKKVID